MQNIRNWFNRPKIFIQRYITVKKKKKGEGDIPLNHLASTFICLFQNSGTKLTKEYNRVPDKNLLSHMI